VELSGRITKGVGSFYTLSSQGREYVCKARGRFRKEGKVPLPGDEAVFELGEDGRGYLKELLPRKNQLVRPAVANLDKLFIVLSAALPRPDYMLIDKLLIQCAMMDITPVLILNKCDGVAPGQADEILNQYESAGYAAVRASAHTGQGIEEIRAHISGSICCLAGQSAVGKSSLMNAIAPGLGLEVGELSEKLGRGKHTTRHAELWQVCGGAVVDTPGFSLLVMESLEPEALPELYPEMKGKGQECRFPACLHISEPGCAVKPLVGRGMAPERYGRYTELIQELKEMRRHRYD